MDIRTFLWDRTLSIIFNIIGIICVCVFVGLMASLAAAVIIAASWLFALILYLAVSYFMLKDKILKIKTAVGKIEDKFFLSEVIPAPSKGEDSIYYELMLLQGKAAIDRVTQAENEKSDYYDYLQEWVHEVKTPIAAITLICGNNKSEALQEILKQLYKIDNYTEQVLYEARTNNAEKDLLIKETDLTKVINDCIKENKQLFISANVNIENEAVGSVFTDEKCLGFILKQILFNSVQYAKKENALFKISTQTDGDKLILSVWDNGAGILESELPRIFDKGFTGSNGRKNKKSTGLGLYLCKKLCAPLHMDILATSASGEYTRLSLVFASAKNNPPNDSVRLN